jgi:hypothetical protein
MSANNSLHASSASASSSANVTNGVTGQPGALPAARRNSFDMVIAIANSRAAAGTDSDVTAPASSSVVSDSSPQNSPPGDCTSRNRKNESFDVESQIWTGSFEEVELQDQCWPTFSATGSPLSDSDAHAVALAFQAQAQTGKRSIWKEWAPYFGL